MNVTELYRTMSRIRAFEEAVRALWEQGKISGEIHLCHGEEAVAAGVLSHFRDGDAVSCEHRPHGQFVARGVDLRAIVSELLGHESGLCAGRGGHMHLFSAPDLIATTGIVGAPAPLGAGFALAAKHLRPGSIAFAFTGDGGANQGLFLETLNLAAVWKLPVVLVCKDNGWAVTTHTPSVTAGDHVARARAFGIRAEACDGLDVVATWEAAERAVAHARAGKGPAFLQARCTRLEGHFLGDSMIRATRDLNEGRRMARELIPNFTAREGGKVIDRFKSLFRMGRTMAHFRRGLGRHKDPLERAREELGLHPLVMRRIDAEVGAEVSAAVARSLQEAA